MKKSTENFILQAKAAHGDLYDYSETVYKNGRTKVKVKCRIHGIFEQWPGNHLNFGTGCQQCRQENRSSGSSFVKTPRTDISKVRLSKDSRIIHLAAEGSYTVIDAEDYDRVMEYQWQESNGYIITTNKSCPQNRLHRFILSINDPNIHLDHKNRNPFDNRKENLRFCTPTQNNFNVGPRKGCTSIYKGVYFDKRCRKWLSKITFNSKTNYIGLYSDEIEAAKAYDLKAKELFGEFA